MPRRKKGRPLTGWLVVDKPAGPTSTAIVNRARWLLDAQKAGHAGTLDPAATGLLIVALGEATKALPHVTDSLKTYDFTVAWGAETETDDAEGAITKTSDTRPDVEAIRAALPAFTGDIEQIPPAFSAVRVEGARAYDLAREGQRLDLAPKPLYVDTLTLVEAPSPDHASFTMTCGKGGYVRAIARDLGRALGCLGHVTTLRRTETGPYTLEDAFLWDEALTREDLEAQLRPLEAGLQTLPHCRCAIETAGPLANGNPVPVTHTTAENGATAWASVDGQARALGTYSFGTFRPNRIFNRTGEGRSTNRP